MPDLLPPAGLPDQSAAPSFAAPMKRRSFFQYAGATASVAALALAGCKDEEENPPLTAVTTVEVGSADMGVLNFAYALEQLESAFYKALRTGTYYNGLPAGSAEKQILDDLEKHELAHVTYFQAVIPAASIIRPLEANFTSVDFNSRTSVLNTAMLFEDLGVAAYNGAARFLTNPTTLLTLGKIVSVEARHAALIRDLISYNTFAGSDVVDSFVPDASGVPGAGAGTGLEKTKTPAEVVALVNPYLKEGSKLTAAQLV